MTFNQKFVLIPVIALTFLLGGPKRHQLRDWCQTQRLHLTQAGAVLAPLHNTHTNTQTYRQFGEFDKVFFMYFVR